jgi:hypothetical protein
MKGLKAIPPFLFGFFPGNEHDVFREKNTQFLEFFFSGDFTG